MTQATTGKALDFSDKQTMHSIVESTTTEITAQDKLIKTVKPLVDGEYELSWYAEINMSGSDLVRAIIDIDGIQQGIMTTDADKYIPFSGYTFKNFDQGDTPLLEMKYWVIGVGGGTAKIRRARIGIVRVGEQK